MKHGFIIFFNLTETHISPEDFLRFTESEACQEAAEFLAMEDPVVTRQGLIAKTLLNSGQRSGAVASLTIDQVQKATQDDGFHVALVCTSITHTHTPTPTHPLNLNVILLQVTCHKTGHISPSDPCIWPRFVEGKRNVCFENPSSNPQPAGRTEERICYTFPSIDAGTPSPITSSIISEALQRVWGGQNNYHTPVWLVRVLCRIGNISAM